jgi:hypothetical protein
MKGISFFLYECHARSAVEDHASGPPPIGRLILSGGPTGRRARGVRAG